MRGCASAQEGDSASSYNTSNRKSAHWRHGPANILDVNSQTSKVAPYCVRGKVDVLGGGGGRIHGMACFRRNYGRSEKRIGRVCCRKGTLRCRVRPPLRNGRVCIRLMDPPLFLQGLFRALVLQGPSVQVPSSPPCLGSTSARRFLLSRELHALSGVAGGSWELRSSVV